MRILPVDGGGFMRRDLRQSAFCPVIVVTPRNVGQLRRARTAAATGRHAELDSVHESLWCIVAFSGKRIVYLHAPNGLVQCCWDFHRGALAMARTSEPILLRSSGVGPSRLPSTCR